MFSPRTADAIVERVLASRSFFGFDAEVLLSVITFENAKRLLPEPPDKPEDWGEVVPNTEEGLTAAAKDYMDFAWDKAEDHRGISAGRSVEKMTAYMWLLGKDDLVARIERDDIPYTNYGAPVLREISREMGWDLPTDPGLVRMMDGLPCRPDCDEGCSKGWTGGVANDDMAIGYVGGDGLN